MIPRKFPSPDSRAGAVFLWCSLGLSGASLSYLSGADASLFERCFFPLALSSPSLWLASRGHFGVNKWTFPSVPAQVYLVWNLGLLPSMAAAASHSLGQYHYQSEAKWVGASAFVVWFLGFALGAGKFQQTEQLISSSSSTLPKWGKFEAISLTLILIAWVAAGAAAMDANALSSWTTATMTDFQGTGAGVGILFYWALIPIIPTMGVLFWIYGDLCWRRIALILLGLGVPALVMYSNRRLFVYMGVLLLFILYRSGHQVRLKVLLPSLIGAALLTGPLLWPIRMVVQNPDLVRSQANPIQMAGEGVIRYFTDPDFREITSSASQENQLGGRFNYADTYLASVQWTLDNDPHLSPSFLFSLVGMIPTFIWPGKSDVAASLNIKRQFNSLGISNEPDFQMTPILEIYFQLGFAGVLLGGIFWGWMTRKLEQTSTLAMQSFEWAIVWASMYIGVMSFEAYFSMFLSISREPFIIATILALSRWVVKGMSERNLRYIV
jgi:hypothetical protein